MCLIVAIKSGIEKYDDFVLKGIEKASDSNTDGIGFTFKRKSTGKVFISKGYKTYEDFLKVYKNKNLNILDEVLIHLRIGNKGEKSVDMNHPFVVAINSDEILLNNTYVNKPTLVHNGTFFDYCITGSKFSDTFFFIKNFMSIPELQTLLLRDTKLFLSTFSDIIKTNKIGMIFPGNQKLLTIGNFIEDKGYLFSNVSYKEDRYSNVGGVETYNNHKKKVYNDNDAWDAESGAYIEGRYSNYRENIIPSKKFSPEFSFPKFPVDKNIIKFRDIEKFKKANLFRNSYYSKSNGNSFIHNFADIIYIPLNAESAEIQYNFSKFNIKTWNSSHFKLISSVNDKESGLINGKSYVFTQFDEDFKCHELSQTLGDLELHKILLTDIDIYEKTIVNPKYNLSKIYFDLYKILCTGNVMSNNQFKKLGKFIEKCERTSKYTGLKWQGVSDLDIKTLEILFNYNLEYLEEYDSLNSKLFLKPVHIENKVQYVN